MQDLTLRAYAYPEHSALGSAAGASATGSVGSGIPRRTLQRNDIALAIHNSELFDFLQDIVPVLPHNPDEEGTPTQVRRSSTDALRGAFRSAHNLLSCEFRTGATALIARFFFS